MEPDPAFAAMLTAQVEACVTRHDALVTKIRNLDAEIYELAGSLVGIAEFQRSWGWEAVDTTLAEAVLNPRRRGSQRVLRECSAG